MLCVGMWRHMYIATPLLDTDLHQLIKSDQPLLEEHCRYFMWQLLRGLHALHAAGVLHRDIKPSNLLVNGNCDLRIADFGISRGLDAPVTREAAMQSAGGSAREPIEPAREYSLVGASVAAAGGDRRAHQ